MFLDSGKCFGILGSVLDSGKCFVPMGHRTIQHDFKNNLNTMIRPVNSYKQIFHQQIHYDSFSFPYSCCDI